jgi:2'-hydroxyisoflavone reductase
VIDTSGYLPRVVGASADYLAGAVGRYLFVSTISVYRDFATPGVDEDYPLAVLPDNQAEPEEVTGETYGPLKALCEQAVVDRLGERGIVVRPGLIVGPHDPTDRFTYWPARLAVDDGQAVLAPGPSARRVQLIDARDLATWMLSLLADAQSERIYNAVGPVQPASMGDLLAGCQHAEGSSQSIEWVDESFLLEAGIEPWMGLPLWIPESDVQHRYMGQVDNRHAVAAGLTTRIIEDTARDTLAWYRQRPAAEPRAGITRQTERAVLERWRHRHPAAAPAR